MDLSKYAVTTFKGSQNIYTVIGVLPGVSLGLHISMARGITQGKDMVGFKLRFAAVGEEGCAVDVAPFGFRGWQNFTSSKGEVMAGLLLQANFCGVAVASAGIAEFMNIVKQGDLLAQISEVILEAMKPAGWEPTISMPALFDSFLSDMPEPPGATPPILPVFKSKGEKIVTLTKVSRKNPFSGKSKDEGEEENDED